MRHVPSMRAYVCCPNLTRILVIRSFVVMALLVISGASWARGSEGRRVSVLVQLQPSAIRPQVVAAVADLGGMLKYEYRLLPNVVNIRDLPEESIEDLRRVLGVTRVELDRRVRVDLVDSTLRIRGRQEQITAEGLFATGAGTRVCICDTGINPDHIMYEGRIDVAAGFDFVNNDATPTDDNGHGSHVAGIAVGRTGILVDFIGGSGPEPLQGIAPEATLIIVKVVDANGGGNISDVIAGIDHCASSDLPGGPADVINLSLGDSTENITACDGDFLAMAANNAVNAGVVVVASSGNNGYANALPSPACGSNVIAVGATYDDPFPNPDFPPLDSFTFCVQRNAFGFCVAECTDDFPLADDVTCYSNRSVMLDVTAPGSYIWSAVHDHPGLIVGKHGTSQAAPHVTGLAALVLGKTPSLSPETVRQVIRAGSVDLGPTGFDPAYGHGRIDVIGSLLLAPTCTFADDCDDSLFCNGVETCNTGTCTPGAYPCGALLCRESDDQCVTCFSDVDCDDSDPCNGAETCSQAGECQMAFPRDCNDNGSADDCDLADGTSSDCNDNLIPDECDIAGGAESDINGNGVPDSCEGPFVAALWAVGPRYFALTPAFETLEPVAFRITSPDFVCLVKYVDLTGLLVDEPVFHPAAAWGSVDVHSEVVFPNTRYELRADFATGALGDPVPITTWAWGDCDNNGSTNLADTQLVVLGFQGDFSGASLQAVDLEPCLPNGVANLADALQSVLAFQGVPFTTSLCPEPCP